MTQSYGKIFARVYNQLWAGFALNAAPKIRLFYESTPVGHSERSILDLCCGSGQLTRHFLDHGYRATAIDLSMDMLDFARENNLPYLSAGLVEFIQADASTFQLDRSFGLVVSTFDALNHLSDFDALVSCFHRTHTVLLEGGIFVFDLNTRLGLETHWTSMSVEDRPDLFLLNRSVWLEETERAYTRITGFVKTESGLFERFVETVFNCAFNLATVQTALFQCGFRSAYMARLEDLESPLENPEGERRVFFVAEK